MIADFLIPQFGMMKSYLLLDSILGTTFMFFLQVKLFGTKTSDEI